MDIAHSSVVVLPAALLPSLLGALRVAQGALTRRGLCAAS